MTTEMETKLNDSIETLLSLCVDKEAAQKEIDKVVALKRESDIKPIEVCIEADEVVKRYKITEAMEIVRCRTSIFFHSTCFWVVSKPTLANNLKGGALFEMLTWYCDYMDGRDTYTDEDRERLDVIAAMVINILSLPLDIFTDSDFMLDVANYILNRRNDYYGKLTEEAKKEAPETLDDAMDNVVYEAEVAAQEQMLKELGDMHAKKNAKKRAN